MTLLRTAEPAVEPVTLAEIKEHLRVTHDSEDALIEGLIKAAREEVERSTSRALIDQSWRLILDSWPKSKFLYLGRTPVVSVTSVSVFDEDGNSTALSAEHYLLDRSSVPARLYFQNVPSPGRRINGIEIDFDAGYGESGTDVPESLKRAIGILVSHWYEFRGAYGARDQPVSIPEEFLRIIRNFGTPRL
jgi:uncharacterized phiE125 gp8 family phage protein